MFKGLLRMSILKKTKKEPTEKISDDSLEEYPNINTEQKPLKPQNTLEPPKSPEEGFGNVFEDTRKTKILFGKYLLTRNMLAFLILTNIFCSLCLYEYIAIIPDNMPWTANLLSICSSVIQVFVILMWIMSLFIQGNLNKEKLILGRDDNFIVAYGFRNFFVMIFLLMFHPVRFLVDVPFFLEESYYTPDTTFNDYKRPWVEYFIMTQFVVGTLLVIIIFLENIKYGNNRADRLARFFGIEADTFFVLRACMRRYPLLFVVFLEAFGVIFFGVIVRIAETNYVQHIGFDIVTEAEAYAEEFNNRILFFNYFNVFWNMIITMTTIGYGDYYTRSTLARFVIIITGFYGILVTSLLVVAFTNLLEMESSEDDAFNIIKSIIVQKQKDMAAVYLTGDIFLGSIKKDNIGKKGKSFFKKKFTQNLKNYVDIKQNYKTMNIDKTEFLTTKAFRLYSIIGKWDVNSALKKRMNLDDENKNL